MDKKAKIREYKDTPRTMGVFQIINKANGKVLIGSSNNLPAILNRFRAELKMGNCRNVVLQEWKQYGPDVFEFKELEILKLLNIPNYNPSEDLQILKDLWIEKFKPFGDKGYNKPPQNVT